MFAFAVLLIAVSVLVVIDKIVLPALEDDLKVMSRSWKEENFWIGLMSTARRNPPLTLGIWRSPGIPVSEKKTKSKRIMVVGDSFVNGFGLANINSVWWRALQRELNWRGYNDVEVIGIHTAMYSNMAGELEQVNMWVDKYQPDAIVWGYTPWNADELDKNSQWIIPWLVKSDEATGQKFLKRTLRSLFPNIGETLFDWEFRKFAATGGNEKQGFDMRARELLFFQGENLQAFEKTLAAMEQTFNRLHYPCFIVTLPSATIALPADLSGLKPDQLVSHLDAYYRKRFSLVFPYFRKYKLPYYDLLPEYIKTLRTEPHLQRNNAVMYLCVSPADSHPSSFLTHFYASQTADILEKKYSHLLGKKSASRQAALKINDWMPPAIKVQDFGNSSYLLIYPGKNEPILKMPMRKDHVQLSFDMPVPLNSISLKGDGLKKSQIWVSVLNPKEGWERNVWRDLGHKKGANVTFELPKADWASHINSCKIHAEVKGDQRILVTF